MFHYELTIPDSGSSQEPAKSIEISIFSMPVLDSRMYVIHLTYSAYDTPDISDSAEPDNLPAAADRELLIIDPNLWDEEDDPDVRRICSEADHATVLVTHSHYDHIAGINALREMIPVTLYATELCDRKMQDSHKNLAAYSMALVMDKTEERQRYCEKYFDFNYGCKADTLYEGSLRLEPACPSMGTSHEDEIGQQNTTGRSSVKQTVPLYVRTIPTPGHSDCSQCIELWHEHHLLAVLTGDSLVNGHDVITRFPTGSKKVFREVTEPYLRKLSDETVILPGHGNPALYGEIKEFGII